MTDLIPAEAFPAGEFLRDELEARNWSQSDFAKIIGRPAKLVSEIINNKKAVTPDTARDFSAALGMSAQSWLNIEAAYQLYKTTLTERSERDENISRKAKLYDKYPVSLLIKQGWVQESESFEVLESRVLQLFEVSSSEEESSFALAAKRNYDESLSMKQVAWLFRVKQLAQSVAAPKYSESKLRAAIGELELLLTSEQEIRRVPQILAECGVRFVVVEPVPGSKICGVCFWVDGDKSPVIGMTLLYDRIDNFWFVLRHELEHVLRGDGKEAPIVDIPHEQSGDLSSGASDRAEEAANAAARAFCVPEDEFIDFYARVNPYFSENSIVGFSRRVKRHSGLVVGRIQRETERWQLLRKHLVKVRHIVTKTALVDGYGCSSID
jgi:HTH-type transcriptional regulator/antitoxin HigA